MLRLTDTHFNEHVAETIQLANKQTEASSPNMVVASTTYAAARLNAWLFAGDCNSGTEMLSRREEARELFMKEFRQMFDEHFDDYAQNFDKYMG